MPTLSYVSQVANQRVSTQNDNYDSESQNTECQRRQASKHPSDPGYHQVEAMWPSVKVS